MFTKLIANRRVEMRSTSARDMRQTIIDRVGARPYLIWKLRTADGWTVSQIVDALELHRRTVERCIVRVRIVTEELREES